MALEKIIKSDKIDKEILSEIETYIPNLSQIVKYFSTKYTQSETIPGSPLRCALIEITPLISNVESYIKTYETLRSKFLPTITPEGRVSLIKAAAQIHYQLAIKQNNNTEIGTTISTDNPANSKEALLKRINN